MVHWAFGKNKNDAIGRSIHFFICRATTATRDYHDKSREVEFILIQNTAIRSLLLRLHTDRWCQ